MFRTVCVVACAGLAAGNRLALDSLASEAEEQATRGTCKEPFVADKCLCNQWSTFKWGHLCTECKDKTKWGVGCDLDCNPDCKSGKCDFGGNCIVDRSCPNNCKASSRLGRKKGHCKNSFGQCEHCKRGFHGPLCDDACPTGCDYSPEGMCTRKGLCYKCKSGFYGDECKQKCPTACPLCVQRDGTVKDPANEGVFLKAGMCIEPCRGDMWGPSCEEKCPKNCKPVKNSASCDRGTGKCKSCNENRFYGDKCETPCSTGCEGGTCDQDGTCTGSCVAGFWGQMCEEKCPPGAGTCDRDDGMPLDCAEGSYPVRNSEGVGGMCKPCPENCKEGKCGSNGHCSVGCKLGFHGGMCDKTCSLTCDGPCDAYTTKKSDSYCAACKTGFTGNICDESCHLTCAKCKQTGSGGLFSRPGNTAEDCLACRDDAASQLNEKTGKCECVPGAARSGTDQKCRCVEPADKRKEAFMKVTSHGVKVCEDRCSTNFNGITLKQVYALQAKQSACISAKLQRWVIATAGDADTYEEAMKANKFKQGDCEEGHLQVVDDYDKCLLAEYVAYILRV